MGQISNSRLWQWKPSWVAHYPAYVKCCSLIHILRWKPNRFKFYCKANLRIWRQAIFNRTAALLNDVDWTLTGNLRWLMISLGRNWKCTLKWQSMVRRWFIPLGWGTKLQGFKKPSFYSKTHLLLKTPCLVTHSSWLYTWINSQIYFMTKCL